MTDDALTRLQAAYDNATGITDDAMEAAAEVAGDMRRDDREA